MLGCVKIWVDSSKGSGVIRIKFVDAFPQEFQRPLAAKLYVGCENILEVQE